MSDPRWTKSGTCRKCKLKRGRDGVDPCLGVLPGVMFACCGHGGEGYIYFKSGKVVRFDRARTEDAEDEHTWHQKFG